MRKDDFQNKINEITEKIGDEASNLILDDIGLLINDNKEMNSQLTNKDLEIERLKKTNETLQTVNGNLLQQISMGEDINEKKQIEENQTKQPFDYKSVFDEKRKF